MGGNNDDSEQKEVSLPGLTAIENDNAGHCIQLRQRYIVMPSQSGLMIIDQHRAHVNVLYARFADGGLSGTTHDTAALRSAAALALARASAIRAGRALSTDEMEALAADLMRLPAPTYTPDGLRTIVTIENPYIDQLFS